MPSTQDSADFCGVFVFGALPRFCLGKCKNWQNAQLSTSLIDNLFSNALNKAKTSILLRECPIMVDAFFLLLKIVEYG